MLVWKILFHKGNLKPIGQKLAEPIGIFRGGNRKMRKGRLIISGRAETVTDEATLAEIWAANPLLMQYLGTPKNPKFIFYCILTEQVRFTRE
jgi:hypothetical protein